MNKATGERVALTVHGEMFAFDMQFENGEGGAITLDSGAARVAEGQAQGGPVPLRKPGLRMCAADGSASTNHGRKVIKFRGNGYSEAASQKRRLSRQA